MFEQERALREAYEERLVQEHVTDAIIEAHEQEELARFVSQLHRTPTPPST